MIEKILFAGLKIAKTPDHPNPLAIVEQAKTLQKLLLKAQQTAFGKWYHFHDILRTPDIISAFQQTVPLTEYDYFYEKWWHRSRNDEPNVTWPGIVPYYALSSGTSGASSKFIPVTNDMLRNMKKVSRRMFFDLSKYNLPGSQLKKQMLMIGSCTAVTPVGRHFEGDLSGIVGRNRPLWMSKYYRPGRHITDLPEWSQRIEAIVREARRWDVGFVVGNPAWVQMIFENIIERYGLRHIHDLWPQFNVYVHGGVFFEPYQQHFEQLLGNKVHYIDSYMASEGFFAYQNRPNSRDLRLLHDCGVFYEFIPFDAPHFDDEGKLLPTAQALDLSEVVENQQYAIVVSTVSGTWRYLLGDTLKFTDVGRAEFRLTGRTRQFLSICGEHLSIDNLNEAICRVDKALNAGVVEFTVAGKPHGTLWAHHWYVSLNNASITPVQFMAAVDEELCRLNDDYAVERRYALKHVSAKFLPTELFYRWLEERGKLNGQAKIPRVMKGATLENWENFLSHACAAVA